MKKSGYRDQRMTLATKEERLGAKGSISLTIHDDLPRDDWRVVDEGLGLSNNAIPPLHEVRPLACFARSRSGEVVGGAIGRTWGACCELQQLWVHPDYRRNGIGTGLIRRFEGAAVDRGCSTIYLETYSFQAPGLYRALGYEVEHVQTCYPHGIEKYTMVRHSTALLTDA